MSRLLIAILAICSLSLTDFSWIYGTPTPITVVSTTYIDPTAGVNGAGTCVNPKNTWAGLSLTGNVAFLQKAGTTWQASSSPSLATSGGGTGLNTPLVLGSYDPATCNRIVGVPCATSASPPVSTGACGIIDANGNARGIEVENNYVRIENLEIKNPTDGPCVYFDTSYGIYGVVKNNFLHACHDVSSGGGAGVFAFAPNLQVTGNVANTVGDDCFFLEGVNIIFTYNRCSNISVDATDGDGVQISNDVIDSSNPYIAYNVIDHSCCTDNKSSIFVSNSGAGSSTGGQVLFNTTTGYTNATANGGIGIGYPNMVVQGNIIKQGFRGIDIIAVANNAIITGNLITNSNVGANIIGIANNGASGVVEANNTIVNTTGTFTNSTIGINAASGDSLINNILQGWKTGINGSGYTSSYSDFFGNQSNGTIGTGSITTDPKFVGGGSYVLQGTSGALGTGTSPGVVVRSPTGAIMAAPYNMGAY